MEDHQLIHFDGRRISWSRLREFTQFVNIEHTKYNVIVDGAMFLVTHIGSYYCGLAFAHTPNAHSYRCPNAYAGREHVRLRPVAIHEVAILSKEIVSQEELLLHPNYDVHTWARTGNINHLELPRDHFNPVRYLNLHKDMVDDYMIVSNGLGY